eukprot:scaffold4422_cov110-Skeletonema_dohrnii-CCMP3373.AAC.5
MTKPTRSVRFAATSQLILFPKDDRIDRNHRINSSSRGDGHGWYSAEDKVRFQQEMLHQALQLRTSLGLGSAYLHDFSEDDLINCTGIEPLVLFSRSTLRQLHEMKLAHTDNVLAAQRYLNASDLSLLSSRSSDAARQRAYVVATL